MNKRMLIDGTHPEEVRVVIANGSKLEEYDIESSSKSQLKGNIYLAKVMRVEPSLQAAFVDFGGNRHGFLAFNEIHPDYYQIPVEDREALKRDVALFEENATAAQAHIDSIDGDLSHDDEDYEHDESDEHDHRDMDLDSSEDAEDAAPEGKADETAEEPDDASSDDAADTDEDSQAAHADLDSGDAEDMSASASDAEDTAEPGETADGSDNDTETAETADASAAKPAQPARSRNRRTDRRDHPMRRYKIQEVIKRRQILLVQVVKEERGNKGAALTSYLSLAGRYCVLMPNTSRNGGGVSRKITSSTDRRRLRDLLKSLEVPEGMGVIMRTAGMERNKSEIKRDFDYLMRLWEEIRELTLGSAAPALVYEEGDLIKRAIRDLYSREIEEVLVEGNDAYQAAKKVMRLMMPSHAKRVQPYRDETIPLFHRFQVETLLEAMHSPVVQLKSGGYIVIDQTEALVAIDVNSGRSTKERNIEETALKTNLEAASEVALQLRLRDLAGLIVIDFIDMDESRNQRAVEKRFKDSVKTDRARMQIGRISMFGLLELSRQRMRPSLMETSSNLCPHCDGTGHVRSIESMAVRVLRMIEEEGIRERSSAVSVTVPTAVALYILNQKRAVLNAIETRCGFSIEILGDDTISLNDAKLERVKARPGTSEDSRTVADAVRVKVVSETTVGDDDDTGEEEKTGPARKRRPRRRRRKEPSAEESETSAVDETGTPRDHAEPTSDSPEQQQPDAAASGDSDEEQKPKRRRRGRRGGRRRNQDTAQDENGTRTDGTQSMTADATVATEPQAASSDSEQEPAQQAPTEAPLPKVIEPEATPHTNGAGEKAESPSPVVTDKVKTVKETVAVSAEETAEQKTASQRRGWWQRMMD